MQRKLDQTPPRGAGHSQCLPLSTPAALQPSCQVAVSPDGPPDENSGASLPLAQAETWKVESAVWRLRPAPEHPPDTVVNRAEDMKWQNEKPIAGSPGPYAKSLLPWR